MVLDGVCSGRGGLAHHEGGTCGGRTGRVADCPSGWHRRIVDWHRVPSGGRVDKLWVADPRGCLHRDAWGCAGSPIAIYFDLRGKTETAVMAAEYTVDLSKPQIRQWAYPESGAGWRLVNEVGASDALAKSNPHAFNGDLDKLTIDMTIRSMLVYFFAEQFDWQLKQTRVQGTTTGTQILTEPLSKPDEYATFTSTQIAEKLSKARNLFDQVGNFTRQQICLPPGSSVDIGPTKCP